MVLHRVVCNQYMYMYIQYESKKSFHFCPFRCYLFQIGTDTPFRFVPISNVKKRTFRSYLYRFASKLEM